MLSWSTSNRGVPNPSTKRPPLCCLAMPLHSSILLDLLHRNEKEEGKVWMREVDLSVPSLFSNLRRKLRRHFFLYIHLRSGFEGQDEVEVKDTLPSLAIYWPNFRYILFRYMVTSCCFCESDPPSSYSQVDVYRVEASKFFSVPVYSEAGCTTTAERCSSFSEEDLLLPPPPTLRELEI